MAAQTEVFEARVAYAPMSSLALIILWANFDYRIMNTYQNTFNGRGFRI
ncbi:hypothetical protein DespoDRAFT_01181 [Desulfobacter postgatei 2ac9]|uniref:Uncharacterized protein n=1 Tax=Desulfobacter postgatei 2ac9 TaxID=879212 RepID=I5B0Y4_9BACT|nr:hypothetical protein DespoDRAFT_01181 [Desulfobacter postgatei 2ac9]